MMSSLKTAVVSALCEEVLLEENPELKHKAMGSQDMEKEEGCRILYIAL
jgi:predicted membrane GTPase involved in stress response